VLDNFVPLVVVPQDDEAFSERSSCRRYPLADLVFAQVLIEFGKGDLISLQPKLLALFYAMSGSERINVRPKI
jgi:hypothetical protein